MDLPFRPVSRYLPSHLAAFVLRQHIPGRMFNDYEVSGYLHWSFAGHPPLFIDLLNAYPDHLLEPDYFDILAMNPHGHQLMDRLGIGYVVLRHHKSTEGIANLARYLDRSSAWVKIYSQVDGGVWVRRTRPYAYLWRGKVRP